MHFADALTAQVQRTSPVCVGLDPDLSKFPDGLTRDAGGMLTFCKGIIDAVAGTAACVKPQLAFFEVLRWEGMKVFWETCSYAKKKGLLVIADAKRGDIGNTCEAYAEAYLAQNSPIDALTVSPYQGTDTLVPFLERCNKHDKGIYVLVKTSNPSSHELQDLTVGDELFYEKVGQLVSRFGADALGTGSNLSSVGAVVGATYPEDMQYLRSLMPNTPFLIPGYGAQGGSAKDVKHGFLADGTGAVVAASRAIIFASKAKDWQEVAAKTAKKMAEELQGVL